MHQEAILIPLACVLVSLLVPAGRDDRRRISMLYALIAAPPLGTTTSHDRQREPLPPPQRPSLGRLRAPVCAM